MFVFVRCVAEAVCEVGVRGLIELIPGGEYACKVAEKTYEKYRKRCDGSALRDDLGKLAVAPFDDGKQAARDEADRLGLPAEDRIHLELFLTQLPASVRASLKRPDDPTGRSVPAAFALRSADDVLKMLPPRLPRGRAGDPLPGAPGWVLVEQLGVGGFGEVWLARHTWKDGMEGAVKFCHGLNVRDLEHELKQVARVMEAGRHAGVVPVIAQNLSANPPWVMFEYVPGKEDLADRVREWAGLPPAARAARAVAALRKLAEAVGRLHQLRVVHRDLKPSNILYDPATGEFRITDFGIGGVAAREVLRAEATGQSTRGGRLLSYLRGSHTPLYASPQQRDGSDPDPRDDVHALGVIGYQMLTGHLSQGCGTDFEDDLRDAGAGEELIRVLKGCTAQKPERRPKDAVAVAEALETLTLLTVEGSDQNMTSLSYAGRFVASEPLYAGGSNLAVESQPCSSASPADQTVHDRLPAQDQLRVQADAARWEREYAERPTRTVTRQPRSAPLVAAMTDKWEKVGFFAVAVPAVVLLIGWAIFLIYAGNK